MELEPKVFDPLQTLTEYAERLNAINSPAESPKVFYEMLSGSLIWSDETNNETPVRVIWALRFIVAYRTGLILNNPRDDFKVLWEHGLSLFPRWIGFRTDRCRATPDLLQIHRRGDVGLRECLRDLERNGDAQSKIER